MRDVVRRISWAAKIKAAGKVERDARVVEEVRGDCATLEAFGGMDSQVHWERAGGREERRRLCSRWAELGVEVRHATMMR